jgi:membrane fusion protein (multidrug efflux system)
MNSFKHPPAGAPRARRTFLALAALGLLAACSPEPSASPERAPAAQSPQGTAAPQSAPDQVAVAPVTRVEVERSLRLDARVQSLSSPELVSELSARVQQVLVVPGESVRRGQLLAVLDAADAGLQAQEAQAQVSQALAQSRERTAERERAEQLFAQEYVSRSSRDAARLNDQVAKEQLAAAKARAQLAQQGVSRARVLAPADGVITELDVRAGGFVRAGERVALLWSPGSSTLVLSVDQANLGSVREGQRLTIDWQGRKLASAVTRVSPVLENGSFDVFASVPQELAGASGAFLGATLTLGQEQQLLVPVAAVQRDASAGAFVYRIREGKAERVVVRSGAQHEKGVQILEGLVEGDVVATDGAAFLRPGQAVASGPAPANTGGAR